MFLTVIHENLVKGKSEKVFRIELDENIISKLLLSRIEQIQNSKYSSLKNSNRPGLSRRFAAITCMA
jgi:hypothetical protein